VLVDGVPTPIDVPAAILGDRTMVPVRFISETVGAKVSWDGVERKVTIQMGAHTVTIWIERTNAVVDGVAKTLDAPPRIQNDRTLVPLRFVSENLGLTVGWDNNALGVYVVSGNVDSVVIIQDYAFGSAPISMKAGSQLVFINLDADTHTVTEDHLLFDSHDMRTGWAYTLTLDQPGTYPIFCDAHPEMTAQVTVLP